ncbi:hypothetical protein ERJ75_001361500 [Trypanosoma vivax]|uniref:Uncharacterized protein n=1 Tax=Trypanosoma vivax (strain Y486) TaxID=1055687 RepID=G0UCR2_TRYVY|nr:hypothetical protein TRVL_00349 [Trypanosoma vivax]KAH8608040.1 hypothetical protein ERJ75_001361500 [Trypanosoma vivax]CCC53622.1 conserved hypothetical protein [Trypanosoma vivax Y486]
MSKRQTAGRKEADDEGGLGQWVDNRRRPSDIEDPFARPLAQSMNHVAAMVDRKSGSKSAEARILPKGHASTQSLSGSLPQINPKTTKQKKSSVGNAASSKVGRKSTQKQKASGSRGSSTRSASASSGAKGSLTKAKSKGSKGAKRGSPNSVRTASSLSVSSSRRKSSKGRLSSRSSSKKKGKRQSKGKVLGKGKKGRRGRMPSLSGPDRVNAAIATLITAEDDDRIAVVAAEETAREELMPDYHFLAVNMLRAQIVEVNARQQMLNDAFKAMRMYGLQFMDDEDPNAVIDMLRMKIRSEMQNEMEELSASNAKLRVVLEEKTAELEKKTNEAQTLRDKVNRRVARFELECDALRSEVQSVLQLNKLNVDDMKRELIRRLEIATAAIRTPKYETELRSMQELVRSVKGTIQEHHDRLSQLIVSIEARDTFLSEKSETMHSNFPKRYRDELRKLDKDHLLNVLDVLSFQDSVVETVGKTLYVLQKTSHTTNVF